MILAWRLAFDHGNVDDAEAWQNILAQKLAELSGAADNQHGPFKRCRHFQSLLRHFTHFHSESFHTHTRRRNSNSSILLNALLGMFLAPASDSDLCANRP